ncbi:MAG: gene transfer agent family protein [Pseudomonadota bacterium]
MRGETVLSVNGAPKRLCLTLGALAALETAFDASGLAALSERLSRPSSEDLVVVIHALLLGGGEEMSLDEVRRARIDLGEAIAAVSAAFGAIGAERETPGPEKI